MFDFKKTISWLYQIASVSHSTNDAKILKYTVLVPIGSSLVFIVEGRHFIMKRDLATNLLVNYGDKSFSF